MLEINLLRNKFNSFKFLQFNVICLLLYSKKMISNYYSIQKIKYFVVSILKG